jgi:phosphopantothenoylcysteine decarboxylase / phosphopantothenate---cysteine ligase
MGQALAAAAVEFGHQVVVVSGPVEVRYPEAAEVIPVVSTHQMLDACLEAFPRCDGVIGAAAPCDYRSAEVAASKICKTGHPLELRLEETPDILASLAAKKTRQWMVAFALETDDARRRALAKLRKKGCDLIVLNGPEALHAAGTRIEILDPAGEVVLAQSGSKADVARGILRVIRERLVA